MTKAEWLGCDDPGPMLAFVGDKASDRKLRLFACACARQIWGLLTDDRSRQAVEVAERFADGLAGPRSRLRCHQNAYAAYQAAYEDGDTTSRNWQASAALAANGAVSHDISYAVNAWMSAANAEAASANQQWTQQQRRYSRLLQDIVGNPFRALPRLNPAWLAWEGGTVAKLAAAVYEERAFDRLPVLADALEEAGCDAAELLDHLRGPGPHVRGCWALDLLLGKS
jgi:hypothetical protein